MSNRVKVGTSKVTFRVRAFDYPQIELASVEVDVPMYHESRKVRTTLTVYRLQCPRGHISTSWFSYPAYASRQWKELVDEYKGKDTK